MEEKSTRRLNWTELRRFLWLFGLVLGISITFGGLGWRAYLASDDLKDARIDRAKRMLSALETDLHTRHADMRMQELFPEGAVFTLSLYAQGLVNVCLNCPEDAAFRQKARDEIIWVLERFNDPAITKTFENTQVPHGVFFFSHGTLLLAGLHLIAADPPAELTAEFHANCEMLANAIDASPCGLLDSYPSGCWPADNILAARCLALHDAIFSSNYRPAMDRVLLWIREHPDTVTGTIPHAAIAATGAPSEDTRGCTMVLSLQYMIDIDPRVFAAQYALMKEHFLGSVVGLAVWREYPTGRDGSGDIDSGPVIFGGGSSATGVGMGTALLAGDDRVYSEQAALVEAFAFPRETGSGQRYWGGLLPVADAFAAVSMTAIPWNKNVQMGAAFPSGAAMPWTFLALLAGIWAAFTVPLLYAMVRRRRKIPSPELPRPQQGAVAGFIVQALPLVLLFWSPAAFLSMWILVGLLFVLAHLAVTLLRLTTKKGVRPLLL
jgi:hypothetical protein